MPPSPSLFKSLAFAAAAFGLVLTDPRALAAEQDGPLKTALVSEVTQVRPGEAFYVGLHLNPKDGYHTYWKFPGIVGVPISMEWSLPEGWSAGEIEWPEPVQVHMFQIRAQGYHGEMVLPVRLHPPKTLAPGSVAPLTVKAAWMCCGRDCNPGFADLTLTLPVTGGPPMADKKWAAAFAKAKAAMPVPLEGWTATATTSGKTVALRIRPDSAEAKDHARAIKEVLFFTDDGYINADKDQRLRREADGSVILELQVSEYYTDALPKNLTGVLQTPQKWSPSALSRSVTVSVPLH